MSNHARASSAAMVLMAASELMASQDFSLMNLAAPAIGSDLGLSPASLQWVISMFAVVLGGVLVVGGRAADIFGRRLMFIVGVSLFAAGSLLVSLSPSYTLLLLGRAVQGCGLALKLPATLSLVFMVFPDGPGRTRALGLITVAQMAGVATGAIIGGMLITHFGWRAGPLLDLVSALLALCFAPFLLPPTPARSVRAQSLDLPGAVLITGGLMLLVWAVSLAGSEGMLAPITLLALLGSLFLFGLLVVVERRVADPLVPGAVFRARNVVAANGAIGLQTCATTGLIFLLSVYLQQVAHQSAQITGLTFVPLTIGALLSHQLVTIAMRRFGSRGAIVAGLGLLGVLAASLVGLTPGNALAVVPLVMLMVPLGTMLVLVGGLAEAIGNVPEAMRGVASALSHDTRQCSTGIGVAVLAQALYSGFATAFLATAAFAALGVIVALTAVRGESLSVTHPPSLRGAKRRSNPVPRGRRSSLVPGLLRFARNDE